MDTLKQMDDLQLLVMAPRITIANADLTVPDQSAAQIAPCAVVPHHRWVVILLGAIALLCCCLLA
jgi:hypothetical protein